MKVRDSYFSSIQLAYLSDHIQLVVLQQVLYVNLVLFAFLDQIFDVREQRLGCRLKLLEDLLYFSSGEHRRDQISAILPFLVFLHHETFRQVLDVDLPERIIVAEVVGISNQNGFDHVRIVYHQHRYATQKSTITLAKEFSSFGIDFGQNLFPKCKR